MKNCSAVGAVRVQCGRTEDSHPGRTVPRRHVFWARPSTSSALSTLHDAPQWTLYQSIGEYILVELKIENWASLLKLTAKAKTTLGLASVGLGNMQRWHNASVRYPVLQPHLFQASRFSSLAEGSIRQSNEEWRKLYDIDAD